MKKLITLFAFVLFVATAQSQSLTEKDITGTWLVVNIENNNSNPKVAKALTHALLNFYPDKSFELKERQESNSDAQYSVTTPKTAKWSYNANQQTISVTTKNMTFKITKSKDKLFFVDQASGLKFEVTKPI